MCYDITDYTRYNILVRNVIQISLNKLTIHGWTRIHIKQKHAKNSHPVSLFWINKSNQSCIENAKEITRKRKTNISIVRIELDWEWIYRDEITHF